MRKSSGLRPAAAILAAIAVHGLIAAGLLLAPDEPLPEDDAVIDLILTPPQSPSHVSSPDDDERTRPGGLKTRAASRPSSAESIAPRRTGIGEAWRVQGDDSPEKDALRQSLRAGVGCRSEDLLGLTKAEREACNQKLAEGAKDAPAYAVVSPKLKKQFDGVFECPKDDVWCEYRVGKAPYPGLFAPRKKKNPEWN